MPISSHVYLTAFCFQPKFHFVSCMNEWDLVSEPLCPAQAFPGDQWCDEFEYDYWVSSAASRSTFQGKNVYLQYIVKTFDWLESRQTISPLISLTKPLDGIAQLKKPIVHSQFLPQQRINQKWSLVGLDFWEVHFPQTVINWQAEWLTFELPDRSHWDQLNGS